MAQVGWAATEDTPAGAYVAAARVKEPSAFARSDEGLLLEHDLWTEVVGEWVRLAPEAKQVLT